MASIDRGGGGGSAPFSMLVRQHSRSSSQLTSLIPLSPATSSGLPSRSGSPDQSSPRKTGGSLTTTGGGGGGGGAKFELGGGGEVEEPEEEVEISGLAQFIQQRRRQASAPFFTSARSGSLFLPGSSGASGSGEPAAGAGGSKEGSMSGDLDGKRSRRGSRSSRRGTAGSLRLGNLGAPFDEIDSGMVMTPTTEEWRQLGGSLDELAQLQARERANGGSDSSSSSSSDLVSLHRSFSNLRAAPHSFSSSYSPQSSYPPSFSSIHPSAPSDDPLAPPTPPPIPIRPSSFSFQTSHTGFSSSSTTSSHRPSPSFSETSGSPPKPSSIAQRMTPSSSSNGVWTPSHRPQQASDSSVRPNLSRGSLSSTTGTPIPGVPNPFGGSDDHALDVDEAGEGEEDSSSSAAIPLDRFSSLGPVDPRRYSAVTGLRDINSFIIEGEAGKGAYGTVRKARLKGPDGKPVGPELIIKFVIKQRILADCWKKHKILGPIPIEVHVLDHLRRVQYFARPTVRRRNGGKLGAMLPRRDSEPSLKAGTLTGHPNVCGMLDFFEDGEYYYLVMPQAGADPENPNAPKGQDLFDYVDIHPDGLSPPSIRSIFSQIADALYFLHEHGIVHRDIKDENIVLDHRGHVQVIDFGSAAYVAKDGTRFDTFSGTLDFAAPEVLRGQRYGGKETDIWALGVLVYVLICGECPFWSPEEAIRGLEAGSRAEQALRGKCPSIAPSATEMQTADAPTPEGAGLMPDAVDLVMRCLEVDPANRPTADDVLNHKFVMGSDGWTGFRGWICDVD